MRKKNTQGAETTDNTQEQIILKMHREIKDNIHLGQTVNPAASTQVVKSIDHTSNFNNADKKIIKLKDLMNKGKVDEDVARYIPRILKPVSQGMIYNITTKKGLQIFHIKILKILNLVFILPANHYANFNGIRICFPIKTKKRTHETNNIRDDLITMDNIFTHWIKEIEIKRYVDDA